MVKLSFFLSFSLQNLSKIKFSIFIASDVLHLSRILKLHLLEKKEIKDKLDVLAFMATSDVTDWNCSCTNWYGGQITRDRRPHALKSVKQVRWLNSGVYYY